MPCFVHQMVAWAIAMADLGDHLVCKVPPGTLPGRVSPIAAPHPRQGQLSYRDRPGQTAKCGCRTSWDGQLTATVFVNAGLQGHFLRVIMRPYVLAPVVNELGAADELTKWNPFFLACVAVSVTTRQFRAAAATFKRSDSKPDKKSGVRRRRADLYSTREYYARPPYASNMHQSEDSDRAILVIEEKIFKVTMDFLKSHNVDVTEYEKQVHNIIYNNNTMLGDGVFNTGSNNQINNSKGSGNNQSNSTSS